MDVYDLYYADGPFQFTSVNPSNLALVLVSATPTTHEVDERSHELVSDTKHLIIEIRW